MDQYRDIIGTNADTGMNTTVGTIALCIVPLKVVGLWLKEDPDLYFSWWQNAAEFCLG